MLEEVIRPDTQKLTFKYDALGRRIEKTFDGKSTQWAWDGNVPLHEWIQTEEKQAYTINSEGEINTTIPENLTTWVFGEDSFAPMAKIKGAETYSIVTDYLGTPAEMYDSEGNRVWACELDIYGKVRILEGKAEDCPFRYQGQYEDVETGLYYNRFRYYSADEGGYLSQDPIGLHGNNPNFYAYTSDVNRWTDVLGLYNGEGERALNDYNSFHDHQLDPSEFMENDRYHFSKANESLHKKFLNDPQYAAEMERKYPGIKDHVSPTRNGTYRGTAPKNATWHHATSSQTGGTKGVLQLVDKNDHSKYHKIYHPEDIGGRNQWGGGTSCR